MAKLDRAYIVYPNRGLVSLTHEQIFEYEYMLVLRKMESMGIVKVDDNNNVSLIRDMTEEDMREMAEYKREIFGVDNGEKLL